MELISGEWIIGIIALLAGLIIGFIAGCKKSSSSQEKKQLLKQLIDTQQQLEKYRNQVSEYFNRTSTLINETVATATVSIIFTFTKPSSSESSSFI